TKILARPSRDLDFVQVFAANVTELQRLGPRAIRAAKDDAILWVAYPKGGKTKAVTDLPATPWWKRRDVLGEITGEKGYRPVACATYHRRHGCRLPISRCPGQSGEYARRPFGGTWNARHRRWMERVRGKKPRHPLPARARAIRLARGHAPAMPTDVERR